MNSEVTVKHGTEEESLKDLALAKQIKEAHELDIKIRKLSAKAKELKTAILDKARKHIQKGSGTITFIKEGTQCRVVFGKSLYIALPDVDDLKDHLKSTFDVLISHTDSYKPTKKFIEYAEDKPDVLRLISSKPATPKVDFSVVKDKDVKDGK